MFTGIVQACGRVAGVEARPFGIRLIVDRQDWSGYRPADGDSVCISGVCLTIAGFDDATLGFDVIAETLAKTTLGKLDVGGVVNLESAVTPSTPLGGHFVQGHVDGVGRITRVQSQDDESRITFEPLPQANGRNDPLMDTIVHKGSIAIDGVSLTVASVGRSDFEVALIPTTLVRTTLGSAKVGDHVNLETDMINKAVAHLLRRRSEDEAEEKPKLTMEALRRAGFVEPSEGESS